MTRAQIFSMTHCTRILKTVGITRVLDMAYRTLYTSVSQDRSAASVTLFDPDKKLNSADLNNFLNHVDILTTGRKTAYQHGYLEMNKLRKEGMTFIVCATYKFPRNKHQVSRSLTVNSNLLSISDSTFVTEANLIGNGTTFSHSLLSWVYVDRKTRKRAQIPKWYLDKFVRFMKPEQRNTPTLENPTVDCLKANYNISKMDIDQFGHANHIIYIRESVKRIRTLLQDNNHSTIQPSSHIKQADIIFKGEARLDDRLTVQSWFEPGTKDPTVHSCVTKDSETLTQLRLQYYDQEMHSKSKL